MVVTLKRTEVHACYTVRWFSLRKVKKVRAWDQLRGRSPGHTDWLNISHYWL